MKKSTLWMVVGLTSVVMFMCVGIGVASQMLGVGGSSVTGAAKSDVNLEKLTKAFENHVKTDSKDIKDFEKVVNDKSKGIYNGTNKVTVTMEKSGEVTGFHDKDNDGSYKKPGDTLVFKLNVEKEKKNVVASDRHHHHYRYRPSYGGFFTGYLVGSMLTRQHSYYGGRYWRAPRGGTYVKPGYYNRSRSYRSRRTSGFGRSNRSSSYGRRSRSGGFGFGK